MSKNQYFALISDNFTNIVEYDGEIFGEYTVEDFPLEKVRQEKKEIPEFILDELSIYISRKRVRCDYADFSIEYIGAFPSIFQMKQFFL